MMELLRWREYLALRTTGTAIVRIEVGEGFWSTGQTSLKHLQILPWGIDEFGPSFSLPGATVCQCTPNMFFLFTFLLNSEWPGLEGLGFRSNGYLLAVGLCWLL